jgi:hypothetical protein
LGFWVWLVSWAWLASCFAGQLYTSLKQTWQEKETSALFAMPLTQAFLNILLQEFDFPFLT